ncbi:MAG: hypothetical protein M3071_13690 [Actinomycetota bacterium]|nr:hypothetical protein [Actinomycetota bacterium]
MGRIVWSLIAVASAVAVNAIAPHDRAAGVGRLCSARPGARVTATAAARWPAVVLTPQRVLIDRLASVDANAENGRSRHLSLSNVTTISPEVLSVRLATTSRGTRSLQLALSIAPGEHFYGLGERFFGPDLAGHRLDTWTEDRNTDPSKRTSYFTTPFLLSSSGYGLYLATSARASFDIGASRPGCLLIDVQTVSLRAYVIVGSSPQLVLERRARLIGRPPLPPAWGFGVWKTLIGGPGRVEAEAARLKALGIPVDAAWIYDAVDPKSGLGWPWKLYGPINPGRYPDLRALIRTLHRRGLRVLGYLNPFLYRGTPAYSTAARHHYLVVDARGQPIIQPWRQHAYIDFTNPAASLWWQARIRSALQKTGFDGAMQDYGEDAPADGRYASGQDAALLHNRYPVLYARAVRQAAQAAKPNGTVFFARSGYTGSERYLTGGFTGDQRRDWSSGAGIGSIVPAMLSSGLSGRPYWGPDIAGFSQGDTGPDQQELWERWLEIGALSPTMRDMLGAFTTPIDLWSNPETIRLFRRYARLHEALKPYIYQYARIAHHTGLPIARPLFLNYPNDPTAYNVNDEYLLGDDLLVAPVTRPDQTRRRLYLPAGPWQDHWTKHTYTGPGWITLPAPPDQIPLLVRESLGRPRLRIPTLS